MSGGARQELRLVESFDELAPDMCVLIISCDRCGRSHRLTLHSRCDGVLVRAPDGRIGTLEGRAFRCSGTPCSPKKFTAITEADVQQRVVFRIVEISDADTSTTEQAPARRPRETVSR